MKNSSVCRWSVASRSRSGPMTPPGHTNRPSSRPRQLVKPVRKELSAQRECRMTGGPPVRAGTRKGRVRKDPACPLSTSFENLALVHPTHATARRHLGRVLLLLGNLGDEGFGGGEERSDRRGVLQRAPDHLGRVDDAGLHQILSLIHI